MAQNISEDNIIEIINYVNMYRAKNNAPPMSWNNDCAMFSKQWSNNLLSNNLFQHSGTKLYGENLAMFQGYGTDILTLIKLSIDAWYNEISLYDFNSPGFSEATGHFTCLVWVSSTEFGMGISIDNNTQKAIISMNTLPPGNVIGEFQQNVLPLISPTPIPSPLPTPVPTPLPIPLPTPLPIPLPTPLPIPNIFIQNIIHNLYNIIYWVNINKPRNFLIYQIQSIIQNISIHTNLIIKNNIIKLLNMVIQSVIVKQKKTLIIISLQNIINILSSNI